MSIKPDHQLEIKCSNPQAYTLNAVVNSARSALPIDVSTACENLEIIPAEPMPTENIIDVVKFAFGPFFSIMHRTGLYNRQKGMWESLARVSDVLVYRVKEGFFQKKEIGQWEIHFVDAKKRVLICAHLVEPESAPADAKKAKELLKSVQMRSEKLKIAHPTLAGLLLVIPEPCPDDLLKVVTDVTGGDDPVGRYELLMPEPLSIPLDLIEHLNTGELRLVLPNLEAKTRKA